MIFPIHLSYLWQRLELELRVGDQGSHHRHTPRKAQYYYFRMVPRTSYHRVIHSTNIFWTFEKSNLRLKTANGKRSTTGMRFNPSKENTHLGTLKYILWGIQIENWLSICLSLRERRKGRREGERKNRWSVKNF